MRKTLIEQDGTAEASPGGWLNLEKIAHVEITSEDDQFPIEQALGQTVTTGWRAAKPGPQVIRLRFDQPQDLHRIQIHIIDRDAERMQELLLCAEVEGAGMQEIRRQQFNFSWHGATEEIEDFLVDLKGVTLLELRIDPDRSHDPAQSRNFATLTSLRLA